ncbi:MAG: DUF2029 domain-containing protein [Rhizobiales bacterium]|nr:DUF2029 domain-containing protein [Hyphomicrobiales bacterium]
MNGAHPFSLNGASPAPAVTINNAALYWLGALGIAVAALTIATPFAFHANGDNAYIALAIPASLAALAAAFMAERAPPMKALWLILSVAILLRLFLLYFDPLLSTDIYRYVWDGKVQAAGINPYRYFPAHEALASLRDTIIFPHINRADYAVTAYPPVAEMFFFAVTRLGENITTMRLALLGCEAVTVAMIVLLLRRMERPITYLAAYAWHPLPMWEIANNGHIDALMVALMMLGLWLAYSAWPLRGAIAIALAALIKPFAALALPAIWRLWDWKMPLIAGAVAALCYLPYLSVGAGVFGFLTTGYFSEEQFASGDKVLPLVAWRFVFGTVHGDALVYFVMAGLVLAALSLLAASREPRSIDSSLADITRLLLAFLFLLSPNYPWYFLAVTPFLALYGSAPVWAASIGALLLQDEVHWDFDVSWMIRKSALYGTFLLACAYSFWRTRHLRTANGGQRR